MTETAETLAYIVSKATGNVPLTLLRVTTLLYLTDWRSALTLNRQITTIGWIQPFVVKLPEVGKLLTEMGVSVSDQLVTGVPEPYLSAKLSHDAQGCIDFVLNVEMQKGWTEVFRLAYSTYPMFSQPAHAPLDLVALAQMYVQQRHNVREPVG
jgi:hypothetical protein